MLGIVDECDRLQTVPLACVTMRCATLLTDIDGAVAGRRWTQRVGQVLEGRSDAFFESFDVLGGSSMCLEPLQYV